MLRVYGVEGCGPCRVTRLYLAAQGLPFEFINVSSQPEAREELGQKLGSPTSSVILDDDGELTVMQGVSIARLSRYLMGYRARHPVL